MPAEEVTISTLTPKKTLITLTILMMAAGGAADLHQNEELELSENDYFSIPEYETQGEILAEFVAPFLIITLILQIGLNKVLQFTLAENNNPYRNKENKRIRKNATIMALLVAGMIVPTPIFHYIKDITAIVFGSVVFVFLAVIFFTFLIMVSETFEDDN